MRIACVVAKTVNECLRRMQALYAIKPPYCVERKKEHAVYIYITVIERIFSAEKQEMAI